MQRIAFAAFLALASAPTMASQTACTFEGEKASQYYELELIGYGDSDPVVSFSSTALGSGKRSVLAPGQYRLRHFSARNAEIDLEFRVPGIDATPFTLLGRNGLARLTVGSAIVDGSFRCDH